MFASGRQQERIAQPRRQRSNDLGDHAVALLGEQCVSGRHGSRRQPVDDGLLVRVLVVPEPPEPDEDGAAAVERLPPRDAQEPGAESGRILEAIERPPGGETRVLYGLVRMAGVGRAASATRRAAR